jgi:hypothetical protein
MVSNAFVGKASPPSEADLAEALGPAKAIWDRLLTELEQECSLGTREWNCYSLKAGWALRLKRGDRNIVYLSPGNGCFMASFALGDKAVQAARSSKLPKRILDIIAGAKRYAEGTAVRLDISAAKDIARVKKLVALKLAH